jgi:hypothetical protein
LSDIERVIRASKSLEKLLEQQYGAVGRGLHEKASSVEEQLDAATLKSLRWVATMRNKVVHEDDFELPDPQGFSDTVERLTKALAPKAKPIQPKVKPKRHRHLAVNEIPMSRSSTDTAPTILAQPKVQPTPQTQSPAEDRKTDELWASLCVLVLVVAIVWVFAH